jgi:hypothetical protein
LTLKNLEKMPATPAANRTSPLPNEGFVRLSGIVGPGRPIPVSKSTWWAGVKSGRFPSPIKLGRITVWRVEDIRALIEQAG